MSALEAATGDTKKRGGQIRGDAQEGYATSLSTSILNAVPIAANQVTFNTFQRQRLTFRLTQRPRPQPGSRRTADDPQNQHDVKQIRISVLLFHDGPLTCALRQPGVDEGAMKALIQAPATNAQLTPAAMMTQNAARSNAGFLPVSLLFPGAILRYTAMQCLTCHLQCHRLCLSQLQVLPCPKRRSSAASSVVKLLATLSTRTIWSLPFATSTPRRPSTS